MTFPELWWSPTVGLVVRNDDMIAAAEDLVDAEIIDDIPDDAERLHGEAGLVSFGFWCAGGAMTGNDVRRELERWREAS